MQTLRGLWRFCMDDELVALYYRQTAKECEGLTLAAVNPVGEGRRKAFADDTYVPPDVWVLDEGKADKKSANLEREPHRMPLQDCLNSDDITMRYLVLTAPSGFGKSTAVNVRVEALAKGATPWLMLRLPSLRRQSLMHGDASIAGRVERALQKDIRDKVKCDETDSIAIADAVIDRLDASPGVILFDALDEVPQSERDEVVACVRTFLQERERKQSTHRVLITSRPYAYTEQFAQDKFKRIKLAEFTPAQQDVLIGKWFAQRGKSPATGHALVAQISAARSGASADQTALAALMTEPMLLTYACMLANARAPTAAATDTVPLPPTRHDLFDGVVSLMLEKWDPKRKHGAVDAFMPLFAATTDKPSVLRRLLERAALEKLIEGATLVDTEVTLMEKKKSLAQQYAARNLSRERFVFWLDELMPHDMPVRAHTVVEWLAQRSGLVQSVSEVHGVRFVLQAQLGDFLAVGGLRATVSSDLEMIDAIIDLLQSRPQWYRPLVSMTLARLREKPLELAHAVTQILALPEFAKPEVVMSVSHIWGFTPAHALLHFVIAWANAFGEAGLSSQKNTALEQELTKLRNRCLALVTEPAEGKPPIELRAEAADALGLIGDPRFDPSRWHLPVKRVLSNDEEPIPGFVCIAAGEFTMGHDTEIDNPLRTLRIKQPFYISRYATTVAQFGHFVDGGGYTDASLWDADGWRWINGDYDKGMQDNNPLLWPTNRQISERGSPLFWLTQCKHYSRPVNGVCWFEARAYARWLGRVLQQSLKAASLSEHRVCLPTETHWERAARCMKKSGDLAAPRWPSGNDEIEAMFCANVNNSLGRPTEVGLYRSSGPELFDLSGNVAEWTDTGFALDGAYVSHRIHTRKEWHHASNWRGSDGVALRGGAWCDKVEDAASSFRNWAPPSFSGLNIGFRVVLSPAENET